MRVIVATVISIWMLVYHLNVCAGSLSPELVNGVYDLAQAERSGAGQTQELLIQLGEHQGKTVIATAGCQRCPPAIYSFMKQESTELQRAVFFNSMGIYLIHYDDNTFVSVMADGLLGKAIWKNIAYINVYRKRGTPGIDLSTAKVFVITESKRLITGEGVEKVVIEGGSGHYYSAARYQINGKSYDQFELTLDPEKSVSLEGDKCRSCTQDRFVYVAELSQAIGKPVYEMGNMGRFMIEESKGVFFYAKAKLGKALWDKNSHYNLFAQDPIYVRTLTADKKMQQDIDNTLANYALLAKNAVDARYRQQDAERTASNRLPNRGLKDDKLQQQALNAAKQRANKESWNESILDAYIRDNDWIILRNKLTGIQTGRYIAGVIVMQRQDGLCSYQAVHFAQQYNGVDYQQTYVYSIDSGQEKLDCSKL
ncbi:hypothetical protein HWQ46_03480 [Shewanella sp. D64]|uniref:hypothetical protein n=1 Tax=unclassified Shewanella TaxID=196818 RepID=UPI0022BA621D|nr:MULTISPECIES: hypothetical protein [unclassified Shewanella]MEC4724608.1 hypothetical protein [Shewanella sp. D64]MEC4736615.1 hypothetical protein [Shewanella sp. E94]WBJ94713.1 hypothetical protein HWQ47_23120 [Shewanella sp. MTB7]